MGKTHALNPHGHHPYCVGADQRASSLASPDRARRVCPPAWSPSTASSVPSRRSRDQGIGSAHDIWSRTPEGDGSHVALWAGNAARSRAGHIRAGRRLVPAGRPLRKNPRVPSPTRCTSAARRGLISSGIRARSCHEHKLRAVTWVQPALGTEGTHQRGGWMAIPLLTQYKPRGRLLQNRATEWTMGVTTWAITRRLIGAF